MAYAEIRIQEARVKEHALASRGKSSMYGSVNRESSPNPGGAAALAWPLAGFAAFLTLVWTALFTAEVSRFSPVLAAVAALIVLLAAWRALRRRTDPGRWDRRDLAAVLLALSSLFLTWPPAEPVAGGWDPGVYVHTAAQLVRHGGLKLDHPDLAGVPAESRALFFRNLHGIAEPFGGMRLLPDGKVSPNFYHAYPALMGVAYRVAGLRGALAVNPLLHIGSLLAFYALVSGWTKRRAWGALGLAALALHPAQIWQARFCTAEMLAQFLILGGFALLVRWADAPERRTAEAFLGGAALGLALLTRYDTLLVLAVAVPVLLWRGTGLAHRRGVAAALLPLLLLCAQAWAHQKWVAPYYKPLGPLVLRGLSVCALGTAVALALRRIPRFRPVLERAGGLAAPAAVGVWLAWMAFNWGLRPTLHSRPRAMALLTRGFEAIGAGDWVSRLAGPDSRAMLYLESLFGPLGLVLCLAGVWALSRKSGGPAMRAWFWSGCAAALVLTWRPYNDLFMMWVTRRYIPVVIPWLLMAMLAGVIAIQDILARRGLRGGSVLAPALVALALALNASATRHMVRLRDWPGLVAWFDAVAAAIPPDAAVYTDSPGFGGALRFLGNRRAYELHHPRPARLGAFAERLAQEAEREGEIYLLTERPLPERLAGLEAERILDAPLDSHILEQPRTRVPGATRPRGGPFVLYRLAPHPPDAETVPPNPGP
jgi:hypothetical protein